MLLKIELENNDEINTSQITNNTSAANLEAVCNEKIVIFFGSNSFCHLFIVMQYKLIFFCDHGDRIATKSLRSDLP